MGRVGKVDAHQVFRVVELSEFVKVQTNIKETNLPALRSGFAGYPINPRWNASKVIAWKLGQQWRLALKDGRMFVRTVDSMLVEVDGDRVSDPEDPYSCSPPALWAQHLASAGLKLSGIRALKSRSIFEECRSSPSC